MVPLATENLYVYVDFTIAIELPEITTLPSKWALDQRLHHTRGGFTSFEGG